MRSGADIQEYQRQYYRLCLQVDPEGMRQQWRETKKNEQERVPREVLREKWRRRWHKWKSKSNGAEKRSASPMPPQPLRQDSI